MTGCCEFAGGCCGGAETLVLFCWPLGGNEFFGCAVTGVDGVGVAAGSSVDAAGVAPVFCALPFGGFWN